MRGSFVAEPDFGQSLGAHRHFDVGTNLRNIPEDPTERVEKASALLDNLGRSLRIARESANELANAGAVLAEKGDRLADVASYMREATAHSGKMQGNIADILELVRGVLPDHLLLFLLVSAQEWRRSRWPSQEQTCC